MPSTLESRATRAAARYLSGAVSLDALNDEIAPLLWDAEPDEIGGTLGLIGLAIAEHDAGMIDEREIRARLITGGIPFDLRSVEVVETVSTNEQVMVPPLEALTAWFTDGRIAVASAVMHEVLVTDCDAEHLEVLQRGSVSPTRILIRET